MDLWDLEQGVRHLEHPSVDRRLSAVDELLAWSLAAGDPSPAVPALERAATDRFRAVSTQAKTALSLLAERGVAPIRWLEFRVPADVTRAHRLRLDESEPRGPVRDKNGEVPPPLDRRRADEAELRSWLGRLASGDPTNRLQAVEALSGLALAAADPRPFLDLLAASASDPDLAVSAQAASELARQIRTTPSAPD